MNQEKQRETNRNVEVFINGLLAKEEMTNLELGIAIYEEHLKGEKRNNPDYPKYVEIETSP